MPNHGLRPSLLIPNIWNPARKGRVSSQIITSPHHMHLDHITRPRLLLNPAIVRQNIARIRQKAVACGTEWTPHFKTHQSRAVGRWFWEEGIRSIKVSSLKMARYFAEGADWEQITIAFPCYPQMIEEVNALGANAQLGLFVNSPAMAQQLRVELEVRVDIYIEIDSGYGRTGVAHDDYERLDELLCIFRHSDRMVFRGFYTHAGDSYGARSSDEVARVHHRTVDALATLKQRYQKHFPDLVICSGDTPTAAVMDAFQPLDEISAGNAVFFDLMQQQIGACSYGEIGVALAAPVAEVNCTSGQITLHGGAVHLSKDRIIIDGKECFGLPVLLNEGGWGRPVPGSYLRSLSQEHGVISASAELLEQLNPGDLIGVLPVHSCLTANLHDSYLSTTGEEITKMQG